MGNFFLIASIRNPKDFWAGILYVAFGAGAILLARDYGMGSALKMGPGYFPSVLGGLLILIGIAALLRAFMRRGEAIGGLAIKPMLYVTLSTIAFGMLVRGAGVVPAIVVLALASAYASARFRIVPSLLLVAGLVAFCVLVFVYGLGVPLEPFGTWFGD